MWHDAINILIIFHSYHKANSNYQLIHEKQLNDQTKEAP